MVSIVLKREDRPDGPDVFICSGTLVTSKHIITAANCFRSFFAIEEYDVILGSDNLSQSPDNFQKYQKRFNIHKLHQHPSYKLEGVTSPDYDEKYHFDVAIIELEDEVTFSRGIFPICLPERSTPTNNREGSLASFAGFGVTEYVIIVCNVS